MSTIQLKGIKFPGLESTYVIPSIDGSLTMEGMAADAKVVGDRLDELSVYVAEDSNNNGDVVFKDSLITEVDVTVDKSLSVDGAAADAAAVGKALSDINTYVAVDEETDGRIELKEYIPEKDYIQVDKTLTTEGAAADSKAVGDALKEKASDKYIDGTISVNSQTELQNALTEILNGMDQYAIKFLVIMPQSSNLFAGATMGCRLFKIINGYAQASFFSYGIIGIGSSLFEMARLGGTWQDIEWVNPPMQPGTEYRTTERYLGKPVYKKLIQVPISTFENYTSYYNVPHGISNLEICLTPEAIWKDGGSLYWRSIPGVYYGDTAWGTQVIANDVNMFIEIGESAWRALRVSPVSLNILLKYTKTID